MRPPLSYVPLLPVVLSIVIGIVASRWLSGDIWIISFIILCCTVSALLLKRRYLAVLFAAVGVGVIAGEVDELRCHGNVPHDGVHKATGIVMSVRESEMSRRCIVSMRGRYDGICYLTVPGFEDGVAPGDYITFSASFKGLDTPRDVDGDVDLSDFYYRNHVIARATVLHDSLSVTGRSESLMWKIKRLRDKFIDDITCSGLKPSSQEFVVAVLLGDDSLLDYERRPCFAAAGLAHILALSGMHVAIIAGILTFVLFPLAWTGHRKCRWMIVILMLWLYALMTGMSPSVTRAVIMFSLLLVAKIIGRGYSSTNALCFAAIAILVFSPRQLFAPGFQLSFLAVFALIAIPAALPEIPTRNRLWRLVVNYLVYTLSAVVGTMPAAVYYFHQLPVYFLVANIPCVVVLPLILAGAIVVMVLQAAGIGPGILDKAVDVLCNVVITMADRTAGLPFSTIDNLYMSWWSVIAAYAAVVSLFALLYYRKRMMSYVMAGSIVFFLMTLIAGRVDGDVLFVGRNAGATNLIYTKGGCANMLSSVPLHQLDDEARYASRRYADFLGRRDVDSLRVDDSACIGNNVMIEYGNRKIVVVNSNEIPSVGDADYLIVCRGFKDDVVALAMSVKCDSILLGSDINARRRRRYHDELRESGRAVRSLDDGYGLVIESRR